MKRAAVITDISALGNCSGSANIAILSALGVEACLIPTAVLSAQTGFPQYKMIDISGSIKELAASFEMIAPKMNAIYTGFIANKKQCLAAIELAEHFRSQGAVHVCDPIIGDKGKVFTFFGAETYQSICELALNADIITPNITELCLLANGDHHTLTHLNESDCYQAIHTMCKSIMNERLKTIVVTGISFGDTISVLTSTTDGFTVAKSRKYGGSISGTGDILTSIICAAAAKGEDIAEASQKAADFISESARLSQNEITDRNLGLPFQQYIHLLIK